MRFVSDSFDGFGCIELKSPERQVVHVTTEIGHGSASEVPPSIPFRTGEIDIVIRSQRCRADPHVPVQIDGWRHRLCGAFGYKNDVFIRVRVLFAL